MGKIQSFRRKEYKIMKCRIFKCEDCKREFYVPDNIYIVNCPCGAKGYSDEVKDKSLKGAVNGKISHSCSRTNSFSD